MSLIFGVGEIIRTGVSSSEEAKLTPFCEAMCPVRSPIARLNTAHVDMRFVLLYFFMAFLLVCGPRRFCRDFAVLRRTKIETQIVFDHFQKKISLTTNNLVQMRVDEV